jgi:Fe-S-cluster containining protein
MKDYSKDIRKLIVRIPEGFKCVPGCIACCRRHVWSWAEWNQIEDKRIAKNPEGFCPYIDLEKGCSCYEQRPLVCRLYGVAGDLGTLPYWGQAEPVHFGCPRDANVPLLSAKEGKGIFKRYMEIIRAEADDLRNLGGKPLFAGPFGPYTGRA